MHFPHPGGPGGFASFAGFGEIFSDILAGLFFLICLAVVVGLLFVLVRFLLVATKAAELYIAKNGGATPPAAPVVTTGTTSTARARTPKAPPTA